MNSRIEVLLFRLYYKIPFFSYQSKRRFILFIHHHFKFLTKRTLSYDIYQMTAMQTENRYRGKGYFANDYSQWIKRYDYLLLEEHQYLRKIMENWPSKPVVSIVMTIRDTGERGLCATIESVLAQIYSNWELYIVEDRPTGSRLYEILGEYAKREPRIKLIFKNGQNPDYMAFNVALKKISGDFITFINSGNLFAPHALFWIVLDVLDHPEGMFWYSDEDRVNENGERQDPCFKPDWNPDLFLSDPCNLAGHCSVYRTSLVRQLNGFRQGCEDAQEYDLALRIVEQIEPSQVRHIPRILYHHRVTVGINEVMVISLPAALKAVNDHLGRKKIHAQAIPSPDGLYIRVRYRLPEAPPLATLIIPTRNGFKLLHRCIESILEKTSYPNYEIIIVDNDSNDSKTVEYLQHLSESPKIRVLDYPYPFNYSAINNMAVNHAHGDLIGFLNNDMEVINDDWLIEMISHALRPEIGAVGARLWYKDDTLQHGGVILGIGGVANHAHKGIARGEAGYFGRAILIQNFSAVTGACMVLRKECFMDVGGFNEEQLAVTFNDVDLCLKLIKSGLRIVWTPYAELYHYESASRGYDDTLEKITRSKREINYMREQWNAWLASDPAYNPNLNLETEDFRLAWPPRLERLPTNLDKSTSTSNFHRQAFE
ncbi:MAG: glycosyltransferase family 2 protein [Candidatus Contendobacter sp.]|nr:glycosyltransferase family 2 protein [Candidatus Contendobacter sp.]MDG4557571.1 glycosyltransferase family 2 protein [Candidatus Contendobacter sp.]